MSALKGWLILAVVVLARLVAFAFYQGWLPLSSPTVEADCPAVLQPCDPARVLKVVDGDTVKVLLHDKEEQVRLIGGLKWTPGVGQILASG
ncbi:MAG: hypothetical protein NUW06_07440 [Candidatus Acetothermia bacterium]|nr:hypothetical protein [Candidatus Acetothermia bacterium]MDH7505900.1 hypothetical protein [Candidatus Acetothermia bacterium]